jgi:hypothetical protein
MAVNRDYSPQDFLGGNASMQAAQTPAAAVSAAVGGGNVLLQGSISRTSGAVGRSATVKAGEDIRPALESLKSAGGGTLILLAGVHRPAYDIVGASKINIIGEGIDQTIIDFGGGDYQFLYLGTSSKRLSRFSIENLSIKNSTASTGCVYIAYCDYWAVKFLKSFDNTTYGMYILSSSHWMVESSSFEDNTFDGLKVDGGLFYAGATEFFQITNSVASSNSLNGFNLNSESPYNADYGGGLISNCTAIYNTLSGFLCGNTAYQTLSFCISTFNDSGYTFSSENTMQIGCRSIQNDSFGFNLSGSNILSVASSSLSDVGAMTLTGSRSVVLGNDHRINSTPDLSNFIVNSQPLSDTTGPGSSTWGSSPYGYTRSSSVLGFKNVSGGTVEKGSVVIFSPSLGLDELTTTTTAGDNKVLGVASSRSTSGRTITVLVEGQTDLLKVDGTTDIAVGDFLSTHTVAGVAAKGLAGHMAFAIALEAYTTNNSLGVIKAVAISPRKI